MPKIPLMTSRSASSFLFSSKCKSAVALPKHFSTNSTSFSDLICLSDVNKSPHPFNTFFVGGIFFAYIADDCNGPHVFWPPIFFRHHLPHNSALFASINTSGISCMFTRRYLTNSRNRMFRSDSLPHVSGSCSPIIISCSCRNNCALRKTNGK